MTSESDILQSYEEVRQRLKELKEDYDTIFAVANTPDDYESLSVIMNQIRSQEQALRELQSKLPPREAFGVRYSAEILGPRQISFVIPANVPRIRILEEAQAIHLKLNQRNYLFPIRHKVWLSMPSFSKVNPVEVQLNIDGCVDGSQHRTLVEQKLFLVRRFEEGEAKLTTVEDLAVAHAIYFIVARENLFQGRKIRAANGTLSFDQLGLGLDKFSLDWNRFHDVAAACYLPAGTVARLRHGDKKDPG